MDPTETLVFAHLRSRGMADAEYEPDGNVPPDFVWRGVAIEARRLNQHDSEGRGLEESSVRLAMSFRNLLESLGPPDDCSWFVTFRYTRPLEGWKTLRPKVATALRSFRGQIGDPVSLDVTGSFALRVAKAGTRFGTKFVLGGYSDHDAGGFVVAELIKNLKIVIPEKTAKVAQYRPKYKSWWLALVDHIGYARLNPDELQALREHVPYPQEWDKVILVNPLAPERSVEL